MNTKVKRERIIVHKDNSSNSIPHIKVLEVIVNSQIKDRILRITCSTSDQIEMRVTQN